MKIIDFYTGIITMGGLSVDAEGLISVGMGAKTEPFTVSKGKRLVLPLKEHLANSDPDNKAIFHPLSENILRGESEIMQRFRQAVNTRANYVVANILTHLMVVATSVKLHPQLNPDQQQLLSILKDADEKTLAALIGILKSNALTTSPDKGLIHIYIKRGGKVDGKVYSRAAIVNFPLYEELAKNEKKVYDVAIRAKDRAMIIDLLEFVFPEIKTDNAYNFGSNSDVAPSLDALGNAVIKIAGCVNRIVDEYESFLPEDESYRYSDDWVEVFDNLGQMLAEVRSIPMQSGNEGATEVAKTAQTTSLVTPATSIAQVQPVAQFNQATTLAPINNGVVKTSNGIDFAATMRARGASLSTGSPYGQPVQPLYQPYQQQQPYQQNYNHGQPSLIV